MGERGAPHPAAGPETVRWAARSAAGGALFPGTYRLQVTARDAAGNETTATASLACDAPVPAKLVNSLPKAGKLVALTFDGGSGYAWRHIMSALTKLNAKGTFFCTGVSVDKYPEVAREAIAQGMTIGNHSYDHPDFRAIGYDEARRQLLDNAQAWWKACGAIPAPFFRPPYGSYDDTTLEGGRQRRATPSSSTGTWTRATGRARRRRRSRGAPSRAPGRGASSACTPCGPRRRPSRPWSRVCAPRVWSRSAWTSSSGPPGCSDAAAGGRDVASAEERAQFLDSLALGMAPTMRCFTSPPSNARIVGMFITANCCATAGASSTLSFTNLTPG